MTTIGATGLQGPMGPQGFTGPNGATGATGPQGPPIEGVTIGSDMAPAAPRPGYLWTTLDGRLFLFHPVKGWVQVAVG
jgi:hypothetical protein